MKLKLANSFSLQMLPKYKRAWDIAVTEFDSKVIKQIINNRGTLAGEVLESYIGHADTANVLSKILDMPIPVNRQNIELGHDTNLIVAQYSGGRLPEGATELPEGAEFKFYFVSLIPDVE